MKRMIFFIALLLLGVEQSYAQTIFGEWKVPVKGMEEQGIIEYKKDNTLSMRFEKPLNDPSFLEQGINIVVGVEMKGKYELFGKALSQYFDPDSFKIDIDVTFSPDSPIDKAKQKEIRDKIKKEFVKQAEPTLRSMTNAYTAAGIYKQIVLLNETTMIQARPGNSEIMTRVLSDQELESINAARAKKKEDVRASIIARTEESAKRAAEIKTLLEKDVSDNPEASNEKKAVNSEIPLPDINSINKAVEMVESIELSSKDSVRQQMKALYEAKKQASEKRKPESLMVLNERTETKNTETAPVSRKAAKADTVNTASNVNENTAQVGNKAFTEPKETKADKKKKTVVVENTGTSSSNLSIGIVLGANMSRLASNGQGYDSFDPKTAFDAGLFANLRLIPMNNNKGLIGLQSEVHYSMMGGKTGDTSLGLNYITIPIMLRLYPINNLYIEAGPMPALNIGHNPESIEMGPAEYHLENMKANDVMFVAGAGASFGGVSIGLRYCHGMSDIAANMPWKNQAFQIQVSYGFLIGGR